MAKFKYDEKEVDAPFCPNEKSFKQWFGLPDEADVKLVEDKPARRIPKDTE